MRMFLALTSLLAIALAGCTGSGGDGGDGIEYTVPEMKDGKYVIQMTADFRFIPKNAVVPAGATVLWENVGGSHNVNPTDDAWAAGPVTSDDFELAITEGMIGTHAYVCDPHASLGMKGSLKVVAADAELA